MEKDFRALMTGASAIQGLVGDRVSPHHREQGGKLPAITFAPVTSLGDYTLQEDSGLYSTRMQVDLYAQTAAEVYDLANEVRKALSGYAGTQGSTEFRGLFLVGYRATDETDGAGGSTPRRSRVRTAIASSSFPA